MTSINGAFCVSLYDVPHSDKDVPIVIQNCTMRKGISGVLLVGHQLYDRFEPLPVGRLVIRDNTVVECVVGVQIRGASQKVLVVGNRIRDCTISGIELLDLLPGAGDVVVANNTLFRNHKAIDVFDFHSKGRNFLKCKRIRIQNNLVLDQGSMDMLFFDHIPAMPITGRPGDLTSLLNSPEWRFGYNWREIDPVQTARRDAKVWIPARANDHLQVPINVGSRTPGDPIFLRPPKDSPLAWCGAGGHTLPAAHIAAAVGQAAGPANPWLAGWSLAQRMNWPDPALPAYVGAVPPEGVQTSDWEKTWKMLTR